MSIPANITAELAALQAQTAAAAPLQAAPRAAVVALQLNAAQLVADLDTALTGASGSLDSWAAPSDPLSIASGILGLAQAAADQTTLSDMRGAVGRAAANLNQVV